MPLAFERSWPVALAIVSLATLALADAASGFTVTEGYLPVRSGAVIYQEDLDRWLLLSLPGDAERLLVFTQCFGGNFVEQFAGAAATAAASAQEPGVVAWYGGYHAGASAAFGPGLGHTGQTVHDAGVAHKDSREIPQAGGLLPLASFSLSDNDNAALTKKRRRVLVYAWAPDEYWDELDRSHIDGAFAGQPLTVHENVGSSGGAGYWDFPATGKALYDRIVQAGLDLASAPVGQPRQLLLFVTDHGGLGQVAKPDFMIPLLPGESAALGLSTFSSSALAPEALLADPGNQPGLVIRIGLVPPDHGVVYDDAGNGSVEPLFAAGDWSVGVADALGQPIFASGEFSEGFADLDGDGQLTGEGEGVELFFPVPESLLLGPELFDLAEDVTVTVSSHVADREYGLLSIALVTGAVAKAPEPGGATAAAFAALAALARRRRPAD